MNSYKKLGIFTSTRADYGLLSPLVEIISQKQEFDYALLCSGSHYSSLFGNTINDIDKKHPIVNLPVTIAKQNSTHQTLRTMSESLQTFSDHFSTSKYDAILILGDRYEALCMALVAHNYSTPIIHCHGGEITEGALDDAYRHSITKLSYLHFTAHETYRKRIIQLGESPKRVFNVGAFGLESLQNLEIIPKTKLENMLGISLDNSVLVTYHPTTLDSKFDKTAIESILTVLNEKKGLNIIFTGTNHDPHYQKINQKLTEFCRQHPNHSVLIPSMGHQNYLSALHYVKGIIGNSSSGILEAPTAKTGTLNIGSRQKGRIRASSVIDCNNSDIKSISQNIEKLFSTSFQNIVNNTVSPFGLGHASQKCYEIIRKTRFPSHLTKTFYDFTFDYGNSV